MCYLDLTAIAITMEFTAVTVLLLAVHLVLSLASSSPVYHLTRRKTVWIEPESYARAYQKPVIERETISQRWREIIGGQAYHNDYPPEPFQIPIISRTEDEPSTRLRIVRPLRLRRQYFHRIEADGSDRSKRKYPDYLGTGSG